jgi:pSer/pThr/pTyr-binding forkhead associated (FHA) protein
MATKRSSGKRRPPAAPAAPDDMTRVGPSPAAAPAAPSAVLRVQDCPDQALTGKQFPVGSGDVTLGRDAGNTVPLPDADVSRQHARIVRTGNSHVLVDMDSTNGTRVNGKRVSEVTLRRGDKIKLGSTTLVYRAK